MASQAARMSRRSTATTVRQRVEAGGERFWQLGDFADLPAGAVARTLSRLAEDGTLTRVQKGLYWRSRPTIVGPSRPTASGAVARTARAALHPAGITAASYVGLATQNPMVAQFATPASAAPAAASGMTVHTRRPPTRAPLDTHDGALLEVLRDRGRTSELSAADTIEHITHLLQDAARLRRLATAAVGEPPRVRAILGALSERAGAPSDVTRRLRASLNPISTFDFGIFAALPNARSWQAR